LQRVVVRLACPCGGVARHTVDAAARARGARLEFGRTLSEAETDAMLVQLRASPEVAWAEPNDRETLLQSTTPSDPFSWHRRPWWLQPAGGTDANAIDARLRGVPGLQRAWH
jgi:hypothetical protein